MLCCERLSSNLELIRSSSISKFNAYRVGVNYALWIRLKMSSLPYHYMKCQLIVSFQMVDSLVCALKSACSKGTDSSKPSVVRVAHPYQARTCGGRPESPYCQTPISHRAAGLSSWQQRDQDLKVEGWQPGQAAGGDRHTEEHCASGKVLCGQPRHYIYFFSLHDFWHSGTCL